MLNLNAGVLPSGGATDSSGAGAGAGAAMIGELRDIPSGGGIVTTFDSPRLVRSIF